MMLRLIPHLECISGVCVVSVTITDASLLADQSRYFSKFLRVNVTVSVQVKHTKSYFKMPS